MAEQAAMQVAVQTEKALDASLAALSNLDSTDLQQLRMARLEEMKLKQKMEAEWRMRGHGKYEEVSDQKEWFEETKVNHRLICHFGRSATWRCEIIDKHFAIIAKNILKLDL